MRKMLNFLAFLTFVHCTNTPAIMDKEALKEEIRQAEQAFNDLAASEGVQTAFLAFAAEDATIVRGDQVIKGKAAIGNYFDRQTLKDVKLSWYPDFIDVSDDGTLGYTYGPYDFAAVNPEGEVVESSGTFHTVWKRQPDGNWKFVYD
ncbi:MAG: nuclear transport factor 2 family protein [Lewinella sp.]|nr:nuclear transport factor 2 family protein [Lewinella sp.]